MTLSSLITSDLSLLIDTEDFAVEGSYSNAADAATHPTNASTVNGIFDEKYVEVNGMGAVRPTFTCATSDVSDAGDGAKVTISGVVYTVRSPQPDGTGVTMLVLEAP